MAAGPHSIDPTTYLDELLAQASPDLMREMLQGFINQILSTQADQVCGADYATVSDNRTNVRKERSRPEFRDGDVDGADAGVELAVAVAVALGRPGRGGLAPLGADHCLGVGGEQRVDHRLQQGPHQIRGGLGQCFTKQACGVDNMRSGHREIFRVHLSQHSRKDIITMTAPHIVDPAGLLGEALSDASPDLMRSLLQTVINALLSADADAVVGAEWGRPAPERADPGRRAPGQPAGDATSNRFSSALISW